MIRKAIIVLLTLATAATATAWVLSYLEWPGHWEFYSTRLRLHVAHYILSEANRSWWIIHEPTDAEHQDISLVNGTVTVGSTHMVPQHEAPFESRHEWSDFSLGVMTLAAGSGRIGVAKWVQLPLYPLFLLFATYPAIAFVRGPLRRWRRRRRGWCLKCGYDLTGNVSGVCPECGEAVQT